MATKEIPYIADRAEYEKALADAGNRLLAIDFTASWCGPCQQIGPIFAAMQADFPFVNFAKIDVDDNQEVAQGLQIKAMPTFKFFKHGAQVATFTGADEQKLRAILKEHGLPPTSLVNGVKCQILGLKSKPECNGKIGTVRSFDPMRGRYAIELDAEEDSEVDSSDEEEAKPPETLALKRDNLFQLGVKAGLTPVAPDGSGCKMDEGTEKWAVPGTWDFTVRKYDPNTNEYAVEVPAAARFIVAPANCIELAIGTTGVVLGLVGAAEHNGKSACVIEHDKATGRYTVSLQANAAGDQRNIKIKRGNIRL